VFRWYLKTENEPCGAKIRYCPYCGEELPDEPA